MTGRRDRRDADRARRDYRLAWRCEACGRVHDEYPEACRECGHAAVRALERWTR